MRIKVGQSNLHTQTHTLNMLEKTCRAAMVLVFIISHEAAIDTGPALQNFLISVV